jgi:hypothetical protein
MKVSRKTTTLSGDVIHTTELAILFRDEDQEEFWVPRSCCLDGDEIEKGDTEIAVDDWWLEKQERLE